MGAPHWLLLFGVILGAWVLLYVMATPADMSAGGHMRSAQFWIRHGAVTPDMAGYARVLTMWALMSAAMMAPTALPAFATYDDLGHSGADTRFWPLVAGYLAVWLGFSLVAGAVQVLLVSADLLSAFGDSRSPILSASLLAVAGIYQLSPAKEACLSKCRAPLTFFMQHFDEGPWRNGLRLGLVCLGCCWALMALALVGGMTNLAFMGLATLIMVLEKLPEIGRWLTRPLGALLIASAVGVAVYGL
jgi:predicted metal-binding membrane protein